MPCQGDLIVALAKQMHLDDYSYVKNRLKTTGKARLDSQSGRAQGDGNEELKKELRDDMLAKRLGMCIPYLLSPVSSLL